MLSWNEFFEGKEKLIKKNIDIDSDHEEDDEENDIEPEDGDEDSCKCDKKKLLFGKCKKCKK